MQHLTHRILQPTTLHPVIGLLVTDQRLDHLAPRRQAFLVVGKGFRPKRFTLEG